jgi:hypothetical protein
VRFNVVPALPKLTQREGDAVAVGYLGITEIDASDSI